MRPAARDRSGPAAPDRPGASWWRRPWTRTVALAAVGAVALAGCTAGTAEPSSSPTTRPTPSDGSDQPVPPDAETPLPQDDPTDDTAPPGDEPSTTEPSADAGLSPTGMRFGVHDDFDRLVIDLAGAGTPGWTVQYVDAATADGSGATVDVAGQAVLEVRIDGVVPTEPGAQAWAGPQNIAPQLAGTVRQVLRGPLFEGTQQLFVGTASRQPFRVFTLQDPTRLVIDVDDPGVPGGDQPLPDPDPPADAAPFPADRSPDTAETDDAARLGPVDLRFGVHDGFDRVVLDLDGTGAPGWRGEYVTEPTQQGSGRPVPVDGQHYLRILVRGVVNPSASGAHPFDGPRTITPSAGDVVQEVRYGGIFEGQLQLWIGLSADQPFRVYSLTDPTRVVIDVQHP